MQTVKSLCLILLCATLLGACGLRGPLYLPDENAATTSEISEDSPLNMDSTDNIQTRKDKKKKNTN